MPAHIAWTMAALLLPVSVFLACTKPVLLLLAPIWMIVEFVCARSQAKPYWPRVILAGITGAAIAYLLLRMILP